MDKIAIYKCDYCNMLYHEYDYLYQNDPHPGIHVFACNYCSGQAVYFVGYMAINKNFSKLAKEVKRRGLNLQ